MIRQLLSGQTHSPTHTLTHPHTHTHTHTHLFAYRVILKGRTNFVEADVEDGTS